MLRIHKSENITAKEQSGISDANQFTGFIALDVLFK